MSDAVVFDHGVNGEGRTGLTLTPVAVTAMHDKGPASHAVANVFAGAATFEWEGMLVIARDVRGRCSV